VALWRGALKESHPDSTVFRTNEDMPKTGLEGQRGVVNTPSSRPEQIFVKDPWKETLFAVVFEPQGSVSPNRIIFLVNSLRESGPLNASMTSLSHFLT